MFGSIFDLPSTESVGWPCAHFSSLAGRWKHLQRPGEWDVSDLKEPLGRLNMVEAFELPVRGWYVRAIQVNMFVHVSTPEAKPRHDQMP